LGRSRGYRPIGEISGYPDGTFGPDRDITRAEAASILVMALKPAPAAESELAAFKDTAGIPEWAQEAVAAALKEGLVKGLPHPEGGLIFAPTAP